MKVMDKKDYLELFEERRKKFLSEDYAVVRVTEENKNSYRIRSGDSDIMAEASGKLLFGADEKSALPAVGDWVAATIYEGDDLAVIHDILPRKTLLERKSIGKKNAGQIIAANIDVIFVITSLDSDFSLNRIERYLVISLSSGAKPVFLLSKSDLVDEDELLQKIDEVKKVTQCEVFAYSSLTEKGLDSIRGFLKDGITFCLIGSSGVGKSTLINKLASKDLLATREVRPNDYKGRHTTTKRQMLFLENSVMIDTPGMREVGLWSEGNDIEDAFDDISSLAAYCKFSDCTHSHEPGCAVINAVETGEIDERRYNNYLNLKKENKYFESKSDPLKRLEKKQKDKVFSKVLKNFKKTRKKM